MFSCVQSNAFKGGNATNGVLQIRQNHGCKLSPLRIGGLIFEGTIYENLVKGFQFLAKGDACETAQRLEGLELLDGHGRDALVGFAVMNQAG